jgi:hypothetical protein
VDFGTAVTFDVVNRRGDYVGGIIAPGLSAMTDYLHEKTSLLPRIRIRETNVVIGRNTRQAMLIGAVHGYRGLIRGLIRELKQTLVSKHLPVVATGGYARLMASKVPEIAAVEPLLTLEGLRLAWLNYPKPRRRKQRDFYTYFRIPPGRSARIPACRLRSIPASCPRRPPICGRTCATVPPGSFRENQLPAPSSRAR